MGCLLYKRDKRVISRLSYVAQTETKGAMGGGKNNDGKTRADFLYLTACIVCWRCGSAWGYEQITPIRLKCTILDTVPEITLNQRAAILNANQIVSKYYRNNNSIQNSTNIDINVRPTFKHTVDSKLLGTADGHNVTLYMDNIGSMEMLIITTIHEILHVLAFNKGANDIKEGDAQLRSWTSCMTAVSINPILYEYNCSGALGYFNREFKDQTALSDGVHWVWDWFPDIMTAVIDDINTSVTTLAVVADAWPEWDVYACVSDDDCIQNSAIYQTGQIVCTEAVEPCMPKICSYNYVPYEVTPPFIAAYAIFLATIVPISLTAIFIRCEHIHAKYGENRLYSPW